MTPTSEQTSGRDRWRTQRGFPRRGGGPHRREATMVRPLGPHRTGRVTSRSAWMTKPSRRRARWNRSHVVVHGEFVRGGAQGDRVDLVGAFPLDPGLEQVGG